MELDGGFKTRQRIIEMDLELADFNNTDLSFTFSDMTNAYGRIDDLRFLADNANASSKSTITNDQKKYVNDTAVSAANNVLSQYFGGGVSFFPNGIPKEDVIKLSDALSGLVDGNLTLDELKVKLAQVESLNADSAFIHYLESQFLVGNQAEFKSLTAELAQNQGGHSSEISALHRAWSSISPPIQPLWTSSLSAASWPNISMSTILWRKISALTGLP